MIDKEERMIVTRAFFYVTSSQIEEIAEKHYNSYGSRISFIDAIQQLYRKKTYTINPPHLYHEEDWHTLSDADFLSILKDLPISNPFASMLPEKDLIRAEGIMPEGRDVFAIRYIKNIMQQIHIHNYFEINYVLSGSCTQIFESENRQLSEGELCIIAPMSRHDLKVEDDSMILNILLRESTFENTFFRLLGGEDLLSAFFRNVLYSKESNANYLLFQTDNKTSITDIIKDIFMEVYLPDSYSDTCVINRVYLLFSLLLRKYGKTIQFYDYRNKANYHMEYPLILRYIQNNYTTLNLKTAAEFFHYSESYLSRLIKKNSGRSFVQIITQLRMENSLRLLGSTRMSVQEISEFIGYDSVDHFSRTFKKYYGKAPSKCRST
jgi:AraC-type DNA-binding domain-containing proteins